MIKDIDARSFDFAVRVIKMVNQLPKGIASYELGKQIIRSSTSINSNIVQARAGTSKADFAQHMCIALKEAVETKRWMEMMIAVNLIPAKRAAALLQENLEIIKILTTIVKKVKNKQKG